MSLVFRWAKAHGNFDHDNAAGEAMDEALPKMPAVRAQMCALPYTQAFVTVEESNESDAVKSCFRLLILSAVRTGSAWCAGWREINLQRHVSNILEEWIKSGRKHRIPLSDSGLERVESTP